MGENLDQIPERVQEHLREITRNAGLPDSEESVEAIAGGWLEKRDSFDEQVGKLNMEEVDYLERDDERGCLAMTYSGSLLNIGPLQDGKRKVEYASIGLRKDVPETAVKNDSELASDLETDQQAAFSVGPIRKSSPLYRMAVMREGVSAEEQEETLSQATQVLTEEFVEVNKTLMLEE